MLKRLKAKLLVVLLLANTFSYAQCNYDNTFTQVITPPCPGTITEPCMSAGQSLGIDVIDGNQYTFSSCGSNAFDTQITVYDATGSTVLGYNDDACGLQSTVSYTATFTGTVHVLLDRYDCNNTGTGCIDMVITCDEPIVFTDSNLPIVVINTANGAAIPNEPKIDATMGIIYNGVGVRNYMSDPFNEYQGDIGIEIRGSSSSGFPKKQYGLETRDPMGNRHDVTIFNMAFDNDWVLFAPYSDKSLIRNVLAYQMGWDTDRYAPRTKLCEVVLNGSYDGVYIFTEKIKRKDGKVGSNDLETEDIAGNELTGDYIIKVDKFTAGGVLAWTSPYPPFTGATSTIRFQAHDPGIDSLVPEQLAYIENYVTSFEDALFGVNFTDPIVGYQPFIDVGSFIDFMLVNEISKNVDGYRISTFFNKVRTNEGGKFAAGPLWDFNLAFGNANYCQGGNTSGWEIDFYMNCGGDGYQNPYWWKRMTEDPDFTHRLNCRYTEMRQGIWHTDSLMARIDTLAAYLDESQQRNFQRWQTLGTYVWPNNFIGNTHAEEIGYLKTWLTDRLTWLDNNMFGACADLGINEASEINLNVFPNPASSFVDIHSEQSFDAATIQFLDGTGKVIYQSSPQFGNHLTINLESFSSGLYVYRIVENGSAIESGKLSIIK